LAKAQLQYLEKLKEIAHMRSEALFGVTIFACTAKNALEQSFVNHIAKRQSVRAALQEIAATCAKILQKKYASARQGGPMFATDV